MMRPARRNRRLLTDHPPVRKPSHRLLSADAGRAGTTRVRSSHRLADRRGRGDGAHLARAAPSRPGRRHGGPGARRRHLGAGRRAARRRAGSRADGRRRPRARPVRAARVGRAAGDRRPAQRLRLLLRRADAVRVRLRAAAAGDRAGRDRRGALRRGAGRPGGGGARRGGRRRDRRATGSWWWPRRPASASSRATSRACDGRASTASGAASRTRRTGWRSSPSDWRWSEVNDALCRMLGAPRASSWGARRRRSRTRTTCESSHAASRAAWPGWPTRSTSSATCARTARSSSRRCRPSTSRGARGRLVLRPHAGHHRAAGVRGGGRAAGAPAGGRRGARPLRARAAGPRDGVRAGRRDGARDARRRPRGVLRARRRRRLAGGGRRRPEDPRGARRARDRRGRPAVPRARRGRAGVLRRRRGRRAAAGPLAAAGVGAGATVARRDPRGGLGRARRLQPRRAPADRATRRTSSPRSPTSSPARWTAGGWTRRSAIARCTTR